MAEAESEGRSEAQTEAKASVDHWFRYCGKLAGHCIGDMEQI